MRRMKEGDESHAGTLTTAAARAELSDQWYAAPHLHLLLASVTQINRPLPILLPRRYRLI